MLLCSFNQKTLSNLAELGPQSQVRNKARYLEEKGSLLPPIVPGYCEYPLLSSAVRELWRLASHAALAEIPKYWAR